MTLRKDYSDSTHYSNGESITKDRIQDEEWYNDYQECIEIVSTEEPKFETFKFPLIKAYNKINRKMKPHLRYSGWKQPTKSQLIKWIESLFIDDWDKINEYRKEEGFDPVFPYGYTK